MTAITNQGQINTAQIHYCNYIGAGIMLHGLYDLLVHNELIPYTEHAPEGYPIFCFTADMVMGGAAYLMWKKK